VTYASYASFAHTASVSVAIFVFASNSTNNAAFSLAFYSNIGLNSKIYFYKSATT